MTEGDDCVVSGFLSSTIGSTHIACVSLTSGIVTRKLGNVYLNRFLGSFLETFV